MRLKDALAAAAALGIARLDAQLLLLHALGRPGTARAWLIAHDDDPLPAALQAHFLALCERRAAGEPVAYLTGQKEFFGLPLQVDARVLVPRPDTETLVEWSLELLRDRPAPRIVDLGTGSGAIALGLQSARRDARVEAVDASPAALEVAAANALRLGLPVALREAQWLEGAGRYDLIVSNPPTWPKRTRTCPACATNRARPWWPAPTDWTTCDASSLLRRHTWNGGWLLLEHGWEQAAAVRALLAAAGFTAVASRRDLAGIERCSGGRWLELG